jgi:uncharacterized surface protein with fasciclin (FAS1) repeats
MTHVISLKKLAIIPALVVGFSLASACSTTRIEAPTPATVTVVSPQPWTGSAAVGDIATVATGAGQFNTLLAAVNAAGLTSTLTGTGPLTVFAPNDAAFAQLPAGTVDSLLRVENREALRQLISYHVVNGRVPSSALTGKTMTNPTLAGSSVSIDGRNGVMVNRARVVQADIEASNGLIHTIDTVLMPPNMPTLR